MSRIWTSFAICITRTSTDKEQIRVQLQLLGVDFDVVTADGAMSIFHMKEYFLSLSQGQRLLMSQVVALLQFSSFLQRMSVGEIVQCATTSQKLFAHHADAGTSELGPYLMLLDVHKKRSDVLDMQAVVTEFIGESEHRCGIFAAYI